MREFWDRRANEDAFYFVDNRLEYENPDFDGFWRGGRADLDKILGTLEVSVESADDVVEIGCGVGRITRILAERARTVRALDVSARMLELAQEHNSLTNVEWILGDGRSLTAIGDESADACFSHVVFQHIPDPDVTLGYVREMGRVLRPAGWAAFQVSNDPQIHRRPPISKRLRSLLGRGFGRAPGGQAHEAWLGSAVDLHALTVSAEASDMHVERILGEGTQWCLVFLRKSGTAHTT